MKRKTNIYNLTSEEVLRTYNSTESGISEEEAKRRIGEFGFNKIEKKQNWKWLKILWAQFNDALVWILLTAAFLAFLFSEFRDVTIILIIVFLNALIGFIQEFKAERVIDGIRKLTSDKALVFRDGEKSSFTEASADKKEIETRLLVPGDVVFVGAGDNIPADGYLLESFDFKVNSFIFTGESKPERKEAKVISEKEVSLADIDNMVFMGESVATGEANFLVTGTGMNTELGRIAHLTQEVEDSLTPLQLQMRTLGREVTVLAVFIGIVVLIAGQYFRLGLYQNFLFALALSVSVVPEGLPAAISVALSFGMKRLLRDNVLAKKLNAVETLGSVSLICTDKTGTITRNELVVTKIIINNTVYDISGEGYNPIGKFYLDDKEINPEEIPGAQLLFKTGTLCNDANLIKEDAGYKILGDPTEGAIIVAGQKFNGRKNFYSLGEKKITENPFSSERMRMSVVYQNSETVSYVKGSPDVMLDLCKFILINGKTQKLTEQHREDIRKMYNEMSSQALRVLAFGYKNLDDVKKLGHSMSKSNVLLEDVERNLTWIGMMAMIDPPRADVGRAIAECRELGIKVIMITGDYEVTAKAIGEKINLVTRNVKRETQLVINGKILDTLKDREIYKRIKSGTCVFARIAPEQKLRIATILKKYGEVIAMTGDGVNDAPALRRADIGVAMGIIGTDVSKESADMILLDDNFASLTKGVKVGRTIFQNLKKFVHYVFTSNAGELFTVIFGVLLQIPAPITAIHILAIDLGTDVFPSFSLGLEPPEPGSEKTKLNSKEKVMSLKGFRRIIYIGIIMAAGATGAFLWSMKRGGWDFGEVIDPESLLYIKSTSVAYAVLAVSQMANLLEARSEKLSPFALGFFKNKYLIGSIGISIGILLLFMYLPLCQKYLGLLPIDLLDWIVVGGVTVAIFLWEEERKSQNRLNH